MPHSLANLLPDQTRDLVTWHWRRGEWPADPLLLPYLLAEDQLAHLLNRSVRTLQRRRHLGRSIPYIKDGKAIYYTRHHVLERYGATRAT